jgi:hypothetical protein
MICLRRLMMFYDVFYGLIIYGMKDKEDEYKRVRSSSQELRRKR